MLDLHSLRPEMPALRESPVEEDLRVETRVSAEHVLWCDRTRTSSSGRRPVVVFDDIVYMYGVLDEVPAGLECGGGRGHAGGSE